MYLYVDIFLYLTSQHIFSDIPIYCEIIFLSRRVGIFSEPNPGTYPDHLPRVDGGEAEGDEQHPAVVGAQGERQRARGHGQGGRGERMMKRAERRTGEQWRRRDTRS